MERILEECQVVNDIVPAVRSAGTTNGTGVDCADVIDVAAVVSVGAIGDTGADTKLDVKLQESDDNSEFTDITGAAITQLANTDDNAIPTVDVNLDLRTVKKRYVRAVGVVAGSDSVAYGVQFLLRKKVRPVTNTPASVLV